MTQHWFFITIAYGVSWLACLFLTLETCIRFYRLRRKLEQAHHDSTS